MADSPNAEKTAAPDHPIHPLIAARWSPYFYEPKPVERDKLLRCLEAARWAASSYNEQPWSFILAHREDDAAFGEMLCCLVEANRQWAHRAGVLMMTTVKRTFSKNDKPNRVAEHDLGLAMGNFCVQATELGLHVHQMAGIDIEKARRTYGVPEGHDPVTAVALGYAANAEAEAENNELARRDRGGRSRKSLGEFVFTDKFGNSAV